MRTYESLVLFYLKANSTQFHLGKIYFEHVVYVPPN